MHKTKDLSKNIKIVIFLLFITSILGILSSCTETKSSYPSHWWQHVPTDHAKSWEILPQEAGKGEVILSKRNELGLLSNFAVTPFVYHGVCYPTVEAFWQMMKFPESEQDPRWQWTPQWKFTRAEVAQMNGHDAKKAGNFANELMQKNEIQWVTFEGKVIPFGIKDSPEHYRLIWEALIEKLRQNPEVYKIILATKDLKLRPDHEVSKNAPVQWHYYILWMHIRELLKTNKLNMNSAENISLRTCLHLP